MGRRSRSSRKTLQLLPAAAVAVLVLTGWGTMAGDRGNGAPARAGADVTIRFGAPSIALPRSFFGFSTEYSLLPNYESNLPVFEQVLSLLHVKDDGPLVLRIGGNSADQTYWNAGTVHVPAGSFVLTPAWFQQTSMLVRQLDLRLLIDLNLRAHSPRMAAALAHAALTMLPAGSVIGFEVGNEPDLYGHIYSITDYVRDFRAYARAVAAVAPGVPMMGPEITNTSGGFRWLAAVTARDRPRLGVLTGHLYPLDACFARSSPEYPTIDRVLSERLSSGMALSVAPAVRLAHRAGLRFRLDEENSVTCGGLRGVSNTFATALWAPDALFELLATGLDAVNAHIRPDKINAPFVITPGGITVRPLLYGLISFVRTVGPGGRLVQLRQLAARPTALKAWAVRTHTRHLHVLLINKGGRSLNVVLRLPASSGVTVERLLAPSVTATSGATLGGQQLGADAAWVGAHLLQTLQSTPAGYRLGVPARSAALVDATLR